MAQSWNASPWSVAPWRPEHRRRRARRRANPRHDARVSAGVRHQTDQILWFVAGLQPLAAAVFIFDGILIGAGDAKYLAGAMAAASVIYGGVLAVMTPFDLTLELLWSAFTLWMSVRWFGLFRRFRTERWAVTGAHRS